jgi:hypothetical protein
MTRLNMTEGFDVGLEMSGAAPAMRDMIDKMNNGGKIALLGIAPTEFAVDWNKIIFKMLNVKGIYGREMYETWYKMIALVQSGLDLTDLICVMTVNPGFGGQKFIDMTAKIRSLRAMIGDRPIHIEIDGGITTQTAPLVAAAGADVLVAGSAVFKGGSVADPAAYGENIRAIRAAAEAAR